MSLSVRRRLPPTRRPAADRPACGAEHPGRAAGPTFEIFRWPHIPPHRAAAGTILHNRLLKLANGAPALVRLFNKPEDTAATRVLTRVESNLRKLAKNCMHGPSAGER